MVNNNIMINYYREINSITIKILNYKIVFNIRLQGRSIVALYVLTVE